MSSRRNAWRAIGGAILGLVIGSAVLVWPSYRETRQIHARLDTLQEKASSLAQRTAEVERLSAEVAEVTDVIGSRLRSIPPTPDIAALVRRLSLPVDGLTVRDQTFAANAPVNAVPGADYPVQAMPLHIDIKASFDSVFALIRATESMDRLVRLSSLKLVCLEPDRLGPPMLDASIGIEAIFEPPGSGQEN